MFTGIIEEVGRLESAGARFRIGARRVCEGLNEGDSVCVNGVCLTAVDIGAGGFSADVSPETLGRSNLGGLPAGAPVNLERALLAQSRLGGHIVQGHVDGAGTLIALEQLRDGNWWLSVRVPPELDRYFVFKGSVAIDGISLTVASVENLVLSVAVIPHTYANTNLRARRRGDSVNLECDVLAKYVEKMLQSFDLKPRRRSVEELREQGY